jgi:hypothetical protein
MYCSSSLEHKFQHARSIDRRKEYLSPALNCICLQLHARCILFWVAELLTQRAREQSFKTTRSLVFVPAKCIIIK